MYWMRVVLVGLSRDVEYDIRNDLFAKLATLGHDFYGRSRTGDLMARATNDLNAVRMMLGPAMMYWAETSLTFVLAVGIMGAVDWRLTLWALSPTPLGFAGSGLLLPPHPCALRAHPGAVFRYQQPRGRRT